jgi:hypothetical protein
MNSSLKPIGEYHGENFRVYRERFDRRWQDAAVEISGMVGDEGKWASFRDRLEKRGFPLLDFVEGARRTITTGDPNNPEYKSAMATLQAGYVNYYLSFVCDSGCDNNVKPRGGERRFTTRQVFHCIISGDGESGSRKPPACLDVDNNVCSKYYIDLTQA